MTKKKAPQVVYQDLPPFWMSPFAAELEMECCRCGEYLGMSSVPFDPGEVYCARHERMS